MTSKIYLLPLFIVLLVACSTTKVVSPTLPASQIAPAQTLSEHESLYTHLVEQSRITILGEMHGNTNSPETALRLANDILKRHGAVTLGLEINVEDQPVLNAFLDSAGTDEDVQRVLSTMFWQEEFADGRSSIALLGLLEELRKLRHAGADIDVFAFDARTGTRGMAALDLEMAEPIIDWAENYPERKLIVLVGNMHARKIPFQLGDQLFRPMGDFLAEAISDVVSILLVYNGGETLSLTESGFAPIRLAPLPDHQPGLRLSQDEDESFDFIWELGPAVPSMPAAFNP